MFEYATKGLLERFANEVPLNERTILRKSAENRSPAGATFLSHSTLDAPWLVGAIQLLEGHGATVYIDKKDPELPPYTNKDTAVGLKRRIRQSRKFVLLASKNSKESRWVPWELGIADEQKGLGSVAILPTVDTQTDTSWTNWEYIGLYNRLVWGDLEGYSKRVWMVLDKQANTATELSKWLSRP